MKEEHIKKPQRYKNLFLEIADCKPSVILEVGTWNGEHAQKMIEEGLKHNSRIHYIGFDLFEEITKEQIIEENSKKQKADFLDVLAKLEKIPGANIRLVVGNTRETIKNIPGQPVDFIFIDGGHSLETIESDWKNLQKFITIDTVIILDDYYPNDNTKGCRKLIHNLSLDKWDIEWLEPVDEFENGFKVQMVKVQLK